VVAKEFADRVPVIGIAWNGSTGQMRDFERRHGVTFPSMNDSTGDLFARFSVPAQPAWVFFRPDGSSVVSLGALEPDELRQRLAALVA
jgi:thioredoxin-related protein